MLFFILGNLIVITSAFLWTRAFYSKKSFADFILAWFLFYFAEIVLVELLLGIFGKLFSANILILHLAILFAACHFFKIKGAYPHFYKIDFSFILNNKILLFAVCVFSAFFALELYLNLINPPFGADSLICHLAYPAKWLRRGDLFQPTVISTNIVSNSTPYFPINAELFFFWLMFPLRNAFLADIGEAPFYFIGILAIYSILRKFEIKPQTALFIGLLWVLIPNVFKQIRQGSYVDLICATSFLICLNFLLVRKESFDFKNALLFGIALGLFIGIKRLNIFWAIGLLPLFLYVLFKQDSIISVKSGIAFTILICLLIWGGYSYIRAFILTGNFLYPVKVSLFGRTILPGYLERGTMGDLYYPWKDFNLGKLFFSEGLGLQFVVFIFPFSTLAPILLPYLRKKVKYFNEKLLISIIPLFMFLMFLFYIKAYWSRYLYPYLAIGSIVAALLLTEFRWGLKFITVVGFIAIFSSSPEFCGHWQLIISTILSFIVFILFLILRKPKINKMRKSIKRVIAVCAALILFFSLWFLNTWYDTAEFGRYKNLFKGKESKERDLAFAWEKMNELSGKGANIAYMGRPDHYPLYGRGIKNDVFYISVNKKPSLPHYYSDGLIRKEKDFNSWKENLGHAGINYLFLMLPFPEENESDNPEDFPIEDKWASLRPKDFELVFNNSRVHIYKVLFNKKG